MSKALSSWLGLSLGVLGYLCATNNPASAQVTSDDTVNTQVTENGNTAEITGGETRGDNLFHSFKDFSVETGNEAFFDNADSVSNIFSRVTGGRVSDIDGAIRANGSANLFLINPAGIIFGDNASLNIGGSFYGSSASSILFEDGEFSATNLDNPPLLTVNAPIGLGFRDNPGDIVNRSDVSDDDKALAVSPGETMALIGGNVTFDGGIVFAPEGRIELGGLTESGIISFTEDNNLSFPDTIARGDVSLTDSSIVLVSNLVGDTAPGQAGNIKLHTGSLTVNKGSALSANGSKKTRGGNVTIDATEDVSFANGSEIFVSGEEGGSIQIDAKSLSITGSNFFNNISSDSKFAEAQSGDININVTDNVSVDGQGSESITAISNTVSDNAIGNAGAINISARNIFLNNGAQIQGTVNGQGNGGNITLNARENISINGTNDSFNSLISSLVSGEGNSGKTNITAQNLTLSNGGGILSLVAGVGDGGDININVQDSLIVDGEKIIADKKTPFFSKIGSNSGRDAKGNPGDININTTKLSITNGGQIDTLHLGIGNGGNIDINATESIAVDGIGTLEGSVSAISSEALPATKGNAGNIEILTNRLSLTNKGSIESNTLGIGNGGNIDIDATNLSLTNGSQISAATAAIGNAGNIDINSTKSVTLDEKSIISNIVLQDAVGNGKALNITTPNLTLDDGSIIASTTRGVGDGGNISINSTDVVLTKGSFIDASNGGIGNAGSVFVKADTLSLDNGTISAVNNPSESPTANTASKVGGNIILEIAKSLSLDNDSNIAALAAGNANGGNVDINANFIVTFPDENNNIGASAQQGRGGNIRIASEGIFGIEERPFNNLTNDINASSEVSGFDGTVNIDTSDINPVQGATELPSNVVEPAQTNAQACSAGRGTAQNSLAIAGKGGVTPAPDIPLNSENIMSNGQSQATDNTPQVIETSRGKIQPARGIMVTESGKIVLTAYRTNNAGERIPEIKLNCN